MMSEDKKKQIAKALTERIGAIVCPICRHSQYTLLDGYFASSLQNGYKGIEMGGRVLPSVMIVCNHCGHLDNFSLGVLGLMENENTDTNESINVTDETHHT